MPDTPHGLVPITLVPVEVFGGDCDCHERSRVTGEDGVAYLSITDTVKARSLTEARRGVDRRCAVELATAAEPERVAA